MRVLDTRLAGVKRIDVPVFRDGRGHFMESFQAERYARLLGLPLPFAQDNVSHSRRGVLRGLHYQAAHPQGKLIHVMVGTVFDVVVDLRADSPTFGQWQGHELSAATEADEVGEGSQAAQTQLWIPPGFAHGFQTLSDVATVHYKCTDVYHPDDEVCLLWRDPDLAIAWPIPDPVLSAKDAQGITFAALREGGWLPRLP
jgi:dTDP-4-dehydrorhamnose 3,5-epimerase